MRVTRWEGGWGFGEKGEGIKKDKEVVTKKGGRKYMNVANDIVIRCQRSTRFTGNHSVSHAHV